MKKNINSRTNEATRMTFIRNICKTMYRSIMLSALLMTGFITANAQYCPSAATSTADEDIIAVKLQGNTATLNNQPSCRLALYTDFTSGLPVPDLVAGGNYSIDITTQGCGTGSYSFRVNAWIDYNGDNTFQTTEALSDGNQGAGGSQPSVTNTFKFTVPCNVKVGKTRLRIITIETTAANTNPCASYTWGETQDYSVSMLLPTSLSVDFVAPPTAFIKSAIRFINKNTNNVGNDWDADLNGYNYIYPSTPSANPNYPDFKFTWNTPGSKCVKLRAYNCLGKDSVVKCINVVAPTKVPTADFIASGTHVEQYTCVQLSDLSTEGPYVWTWEAYDSSDLFNIKDVTSGAVIWGTSPTTQNPVACFYEPGCYTVTLQCKNDVGVSALKKKTCYITVVDPTQFNLCYGGNITESPTGTVYDWGGPFANYTTSGSDPGCARLRITPCNAKKINLVFTQVKFAKSDHVVRVFDGPNTGAKLLYTVTNNDRTKLPLTITATSGSMYIDFNATSGSTDSGFAAYFTSELGTASPPTPAFATITTPVYNRVVTRHINNTTGIVGTPDYTWYIDGTPVTALNELVENPDGSGRIDLYHPYYTDGPYNVCLEVKSCVGISKTCNTVNVVTPNTPTSIDFTASNQRPALSEIVAMMPLTDKADKFLWTVSPATGYTVTGATQPKTGQLFGQYPNLKFTTAGKYTISLRAWNSNDSTNTVSYAIKNKYIVVIDMCKPVSALLSADVDINRVTIKDASSKVLLDNQTAGGVAGYTDYSLTNKATLFFGTSYSLEVSRNTNIDPANRKAWIDFNIDGDFDDNGEEILTEASANTLSKMVTFQVPSLKNAFEGKTRMRIAINYASNSTVACGPIVAGEYEDYAITLSRDADKPVITLNGPDTVWFERCFPYVDMRAKAFDATQGDITGNIVMTTDLVDSCVSSIYTTEFNVEDASGNKAATVRRTIIVVLDKTAPVITVGGVDPYYIEARRDNPPYTEPAQVSANDNTDGDITSAIVVSGSVNTRALGTYVLTYTVRDAQGNEDVKTRTVIVRDTKAPVILKNGVEAIQVNSLWVDETAAFDSFDNAPVLIGTPGYAGPVNSRKIGLYPVAYSVTDASGNTYGPVVRNYMVNDYIPPVITFKGPKGDVYFHDVHAPYTTQRPQRSDNYYDTSEVSLVLTNPNVVNAHKLGTYVEIWQARDLSGNTTVAERTVYVVDHVPPVIFAPPIRACVESPINPFEDVSTSDNYYEPDMLLPLVEVVYSNVNQWQAGNYIITYRVTDPSGNTSDLFTRSVEYTYWPNCVNSLSVADTKVEDAVTVFPNPNNGIFTIEIKGTAPSGKAEVYNMLGALVGTQVYTGNTVNMDVTGLANGIYLLKVYNGENLVTRKVTIAR